MTIGHWVNTGLAAAAAQEMVLFFLVVLGVAFWVSWREK
jgi:hypothetical protein